MKFDPAQLVAIVDSREQRPLDLAPIKTETGSLYTADYSLKGLTDHVAIERKSLSDLLGCVGGGRERFERELIRLRGYPVSCIIVETDWQTIESEVWRTPPRKLNANQVMGALTGWIAGGHNVILAGDRPMAARICRSVLIHAARRRFRECKELMSVIRSRIA